MSQHFFIGIDLGGTFIKAGIYTNKGEEIAIVEQQQTLLTPQIGFSERGLNQLWQSACFVIQESIKLANVDANSIKAISFSSHGKGLYLLGKDGEDIYNGILSSDTRAQAIVDELIQNGVAQNAYQKSLQQLWPSHPAALLLWLKNNNPDLYNQIGHILMAHDYVRYRLTGNINCEVTNISGSNLYNQYQSDYDDELLELFNIEDIKDKLSPIISSTQLAGKITPEVASLTGLAAGTAVFGGLFDVVGAALTSGIQDASSLSAVAGTWTISTRIFDNIILTDYPYVWGKYCVDNKYFVHEGSPTSASNLSWFIDQFFPNQDDVYTNINQWVEECYQKDSAYPFFYPWLFGSNFDSLLAANFIGLQGHHSKKEMLYAIYEGIVFSHLLHQDWIIELPPETKVIRFNGGPTRSSVWMQIFCDATNLPIEIVDIKQSGCLAAALCASVGWGEYKDFEQALSNCNLPILRLTPNPQKHKVLRARFEQFKKIAQSLAACSKNLK